MTQLYEAIVLRTTRYRVVFSRNLSAIYPDQHLAAIEASGGNVEQYRVQSEYPTGSLAVEPPIWQTVGGIYTAHEAIGLPSTSNETAMFEANTAE
jgi:hypothetical protein